MRLLHLSLPVSDVASVAAYFRDVLQLEVNRERQRAVRIRD